MARCFNPDFFRVFNASIGVQTIGYPCRLNEVLSNAEVPVCFSKFVIRL
jgi:hypothetical protein